MCIYSNRNAPQQAETRCNLALEEHPAHPKALYRRSVHDTYEREIFIDNLLVRVHLIIEISRPALRHGMIYMVYPICHESVYNYRRSV